MRVFSPWKVNWCQEATIADGCAVKFVERFSICAGDCDGLNADDCFQHVHPHVACGPGSGSVLRKNVSRTQYDRVRTDLKGNRWQQDGVAFAGSAHTLDRALFRSAGFHQFRKRFCEGRIKLHSRALRPRGKHSSPGKGSPIARMRGARRAAQESALDTLRW